VKKNGTCTCSGPEVTGAYAQKAKPRFMVIGSEQRSVRIKIAPAERPAGVRFVSCVCSITEVGLIYD